MNYIIYLLLTISLLSMDTTNNKIETYLQQQLTVSIQGCVTRYKGISFLKKLLVAIYQLEVD